MASEGTNAPQAYQSPPNWGVGPDHPPATVQAPATIYPDLNAAPADNFQPSPPPNVQYVDQNGNPVQMNSNIQYVDQYGNPVSPPLVTQQPQSNIRYVDQFGNPVVPPPNVSVQQGGTQTTVRVGAMGTTVSTMHTAATVPTVVTNHVVPQHTPAQILSNRKNCVAVLGIMTMLSLFIGIAIDNLAHYDSWYDSSTTTCGWTKLSVDCQGFYYDSCYEYSSRYDDLCDKESEYEDYEDQTNDYGSWCGTHTAATTSLILVISAVTLVIIGTLRVKWDQCCCKCSANIWFCLAQLGCLLSIVVWAAGDEVCLGSNSHLALGATMYFVIAAMILLFVMTMVTRSIAKQERTMNQ